MIDVSDLMFDSDFAARYKVHRTSKKWFKGRIIEDKMKILNFYGSVQPANNDDLEQFPEGDRERGLMKFFCAPPNKIYITCEYFEDNEDNFISDEIEYEESLYKIIRVAQWSKNGFIRAFGYKIGAVLKNG